MRTAVVRIDVDPQNTLPAERRVAGIAELTTHGLHLHRQTGDRKLELVLQSPDAATARTRVDQACAAVFGISPMIESVSFISRGSDEDALGVVEAFGATARLERLDEDGEEVAVFTLAAADRRRIPESRLHTALEAALNCEVRLEFA